MRVYRLAIMTLLAGLTVILLGTAVYAMQTPSAPITHNELYKQTQRDTPLRLSARGADYLAIVADEAGFMQALAPLLAYREDEGLQVTAVSLAQIAAEFGDGEASPQAIRDFLAYTVENWQPAPQFVLLVGDATNDGQPGGSGQNLLPTYLLETDDGSAAASDSWYISFDAPASPSIGRFPVQTTEQLTAVVNKTIAYETAVAKSPQATWLQRALLIADDEAYFDTATDHLEANLDDSGYQIHDLHMSQDADIYANIVTVLNRGVGLLNYTGHGGKTSFADGAAFTADGLVDSRKLAVQDPTNANCAACHGQVHPSGPQPCPSSPTRTRGVGFASQARRSAARNCSIGCAPAIPNFRSITMNGTPVAPSSRASSPSCSTFARYRPSVSTSRTSSPSSPSSTPRVTSASMSKIERASPKYAT